MSRAMRYLPDFNISLREATEFIMDSDLARRAFDEKFLPQPANIVRDLIEQIHLLALSCHLPEYTEHGLPHICSVIKRISDWGYKIGWLEGLRKNEATLLLFGAIIHDIGMLSQREDDLGNIQGPLTNKHMIDVPEWVRNTHCQRIEGILKDILQLEKGYRRIEKQLELISQVGSAHEKWPWEFKTHFSKIQSLTTRFDIDRVYGLSSVIAISDLLDEDSERCDTETLLKHRQGTTKNKSHWLRHGLTEKRVEIMRTPRGRISIDIYLCRPPDVSDKLKMVRVYQCLENHYRLIFLYNNCLRKIGAHIPVNSLHFKPKRVDSIEKYDRIPINEYLKNWQRDSNLRDSLAEHLIDTFMREVRCDYKDGITKENCEPLLQSVDLGFYISFLGKEPLTDEEKGLNVLKG